MKAFALTTAFNEAFFLPRWVAYYASQVGQENLFILDHGSTDLSTYGLGRANIIRVPRSNYDEVQRIMFLSDFFSSMLRYYDAGFVGDTDEFVVADPQKFANLSEFAANTQEDALACIGLELFHIRNLEPGFSESLPILAQRTHVLFDSWMCKRSFGRKPVIFGGGLHTSDQPVAFDENLFLIHLKNFDYRHRLARQEVTATWQYAGDYGAHARKSAKYIDDLFDRIDRKISDGDVVPGFEFSDETEKCKQRAVINPSGEYDFNLNGGFTADNLRVLPAHFSRLF